MLITLRTKVSIALLTAASLCSGCGSNSSSGATQPKLTQQQLDKETKESQPITNVITLKNSNDSLTYTNIAQPYAHYKWTIVDENSEPLPFYGQGSNEVTISHMTEKSKSTGNINISCTVMLGKQTPNTVTEVFTVGQSAIERLKIQAEATKARMEWETSTKGITDDNELNDKIATMKLTEKDAELCLAAIKKFNIDQPIKDNVTKKKISNEWAAIQTLLIQAPFFDETYKQKYPEESLGSLALDKLKDLLTKETDDIIAAVKANSGSNDETQRRPLQMRDVNLSVLNVLLANHIKSPSTSSEAYAKTATLYKELLQVHTRYLKLAYDISGELFLSRLDDLSNAAILLKLPLGDYRDFLTVTTNRLSALGDDGIQKGSVEKFSIPA